ncbi:prolyl 3-hydroxylase 2 [Alexandromys fortis]|uniref:prolyl 3-hydroxylase 2 n=1 Tax=Alexandromys fortis TaxID=100897 RepID=UPI00215354BF|nr:prolyl 3-hydroxylase 2 [Microtus fortis]
MRESTWVSLPLLLLLLLLPAPQWGGPQDGRPEPEPEPERGPLQPFDLLYASGVAAYYSGDYERAVRDLEAALRSHRRLRDIRTRCARHCAARRPLAPPGAGPGAELPFFRALLERARCSRSCQRQRLGGPVSRHRVSEDVRSDFQRRVPYNYLQRAYIKLNQLEKAMEAAHTFFMANPEHMEMQQSIEDYRATAGVDTFQLVDREARRHLTQLENSMGKDNVNMHIKNGKAPRPPSVLCQCMSCRSTALPKVWPQHLEDTHFLSCLPDHYMQVLVCQHECVRELATRPGRLSPIENFLPLHYDYLQFAYYRVGEYVKALECSKAYLMFHPDDEDVLDNVDYYESLLDNSIDPASIEAREDLAAFIKRYNLESELIKSAAEGLGFLYSEPNYWISYGGRQDENRVPSGVNVEGAEVHGLSMGKKPPPKIDRDLREGGPLLYENITFVYNSEQLNGTQRVLLDNVLSEEQCRELHSVASGIMLVGDGYRGKTSPHTPNEKFEGATVLKALKFGYEGRVPLKSARLFYDISEKARKIVESYFMLNSTLYFSYTHMVCRTALSGQQDRRNDLSHPIHADNCLLDPEANECWKEPPAYTFRDYSALLYMNDDFEGGEFIFTEMDAKTVTASIKPKCGRMISFSSGGENPHGVKAVTKGQRCAVALWFTLDPLYRELERIQADEVIAILDQEQRGKHGLNINPRDEL